MVAPVLNPAASPTLPGVVENAANPTGSSIAGLVVDGTITDADGAVKAIAVEALDMSLGSWQYSLDSGSSWLTIQSGLLNSSTNSLGLLLGPGNRIRLLPFGELSGSASAAITFRAWDMSAGSAGQYMVTTPGVGAFSSASDSASLVVSAVNDAPSFAPPNGNGLQFSTLGDGWDLGRSLVLLPDGRFVAAGAAGNGGGFEYGFARLNANGSLDTTFGSNGKTSVSMGAGLDLNEVRNLAGQADGKIVLAGGIAGNFGAVRLNADGSLDTTFATAGKAVVSISAGYDMARGVAIQPDGRIVLAGQAYNGADTAFGVLRLNADGSPDSSFGSGGKTVITATHGYANAVALQADGRIVLTGNEYAQNTVQFSIVRLLPNGSLDTGFGNGGKVVVPVGADSHGESLLVQDDGKLIVAGGSDSAFGMLRLTSNGSLDNSFGSAGAITVNFGAYASGYSAALQADGKIVVSGNTRLNGVEAFAVVRLGSNGALDAGFGTGGRVTVPIATGDGYGTAGRSLAVQSDGKLLLSGDFYTGSNPAFGTDGKVQFALLRLNADGSLDPSFAGNPVSTLGGSVNYTQGGAAVVLDSDVSVFDAELSAAGNWDGASLTLARDSGANAQDQFSATGTLGALTQGAGLMVAGITIGSVVANTGGSLVLSFGAASTSALISTALRQIAYSNNAVSPAASASIGWTLSDGNSAAQGTGGALLAHDSVLVHIATANVLAPVATPVVLGASPEDTVRSISAAQLLAGVSDADTSHDGLSIAALALTSGGGVLSGSAATGWSYRPVANFNGNVQFSYSASDGQFSSSATASLAVTPVNDAPLGSVSVSGTARQGQTLSAANTLSDPDGPAQLSINYQWLADGSSIAGATATTLFLGQAQIGKAISVRAAYIDANGTAEAFTAAATNAVLALPPSVTTQGRNVDANGALPAQSLIAAVSDPNHYGITAYSFTDQGVGGGYFALEGIRQADNQAISVSAGRLSKLVYMGGNAAGVETVGVSVFDGQWSSAQTASVTTLAPPPALPQLTVASKLVPQNTAIAAGSLVARVASPGGHAITQYAFTDIGADGGYLSLNGVPQAANTLVTVQSADLVRLQYVGGAAAGSETVDVAVWDGQWSLTQHATHTTAAAATPVFQVVDRVLDAKSAIAAAGLLNLSNAATDFPITTFLFRDNGLDGGGFVRDGVKQAPQTWISVKVADLPRLQYVAGGAAGNETIDIQARNANGDSGTATASVFTQLPVAQAPPPAFTIAATDQSVGQNLKIQAGTLLGAIGPAGHAGASHYLFYDDGTGGGYFSLNNVPQAAGNTIVVSADDLSKLVYVGGPVVGKEPFIIKAYANGEWSSQSVGTVTTIVPPSSLPVLTVQNASVGLNAALQASSLIATQSDPGNQAITAYNFRDGGSAGGYLSLFGAKQLANTWITVQAADLPDLLYVGGASAGSEKLDIAVAAHGEWSRFQTATVTSAATIQPVVLAQDLTVAANAHVAAASLVASASSGSSVPVDAFEFRDNGSTGGHLALNGATQPANTWVRVPAASLGTLEYVGGSTFGIETVDIAALEGNLRSNYATAQVLTVGAAAPNPVLARLHDAEVRADVAAGLSGNSLDFSDLLKILGDAASGGVSAGEFSDLQVLAASLNAPDGIATLPYLAYISDQLVNGDPWNATWTGGALSSIDLGNLAAGTNELAMNRLIGKWFLGTDLPAPIFENARIASYRPVTDPLFGADGPSPYDINQRSFGDCYLLSSLLQVALNEPGVIVSMITDNGEFTASGGARLNSYGVRFYVNGDPVYVTVNSELPYFDGAIQAGNNGSVSWVPLLEKAYVGLNAQPGLPGGHTQGNQYSLIIGGSSDPLTQITGREVMAYDSSQYTAAGWNGLYDILVRAISNRREVDVATFKDSYDSEHKLLTVEKHMFSNVGLDALNGEFVLRNPWGVVNGQYWRTEFDQTLDQLKSVNAVFFVASDSADGMPQAPGLRADSLAVSASFGAGELGSVATLVDSAAGLVAQLQALEPVAASGLLGWISLTDPGTPMLSLTAAQLVSAALVLGRIDGGHAFTISGSAQGDSIDLSIGKDGDTVFAGEGNDTILGGPGDDRFDGGAGSDTVVYQGPRGAYVVSASGSGFTVSGGDDGTDTLVHVETVQFADRSMPLGLAIGTSIEALAYSWKAHTLLTEVALNGAGHSLATDAQGSARLDAVTDLSLTLTASRAVPASEAAATSGAVNLQDAIAIMRMIVGLNINGSNQPLSPYQALAADFDGNGVVALGDAIGVLRYVVGLSAPEPAWHFVDEGDTRVAALANLSPGLPGAIGLALNGAGAVHLGLVAYLGGDVDGSYGGAAGAADLDSTIPDYFSALVAAHPTLSLAQFGIYA